MMSRYKIKRIVKKNKRKKEFVNMNSVNSVLVLIEGSSIEKINRFISLVKQTFIGKKVLICVYMKRIPRNEKDFLALCDKLILKRELNLWGNPTKNQIEFVQSFSCDLLLNLEMEPNNVLDLLTAASPARMKCGKKHSFPSLFDFMIELSSNQDEKALFEQILFYLNSMQVKN